MFPKTLRINKFEGFFVEILQLGNTTQSCSGMRNETAAPLEKSQMGVWVDQRNGENVLSKIPTVRESFSHSVDVRTSRHNIPRYTKGNRLDMERCWRGLSDLS